MNSVMQRTNINYLALIGIIALLVSGCGSSVENPVNSPDEENNQIRSGELTINVQATNKTVSPDEEVELTATVEAIKSNILIFRWVNLTGYGTLSNTDQPSTIWTAPTGEEIDAGQVKVEVLHLVVTAISQIISVTDSKVNSDTEINTATKTIPLTIIGSFNNP